MDRQITLLKKRLAKKSKRGFRGYPVGTLSCYGPDDRRASKLKHRRRSARQPVSRFAIDSDQLALMDMPFTDA